MDRWLLLLVTAGLVAVFCVLQFVIVYAEVGKTTVLSGGTFSTISSAAGKIKATNQKTTVTILGSGGISVSANPATKTLLIDGGGLIPSWANITDKPDVFTPAAHTQAATTITGLATVATSGSYSDLANKPTIPAAQVAADWNSIINPTQILNKPVIPELCGTGENAIFDGAPALSCAILGNLAFTFNAMGQNPLPSMLPYTVVLYEVGLNNNQPVTPDTIRISTADNSLIFSNATSASFTPTIFGTYSANKNNWIKATITKGLKTCIALVPISVTKEGAAGAAGAQGVQGEQGIQGIQGPPGDSPTVNKGAVQGEFTMNNPGGTSFTVRPDSSTGQTNATELITAGDVDGNKRMIVTGDTTTLNTLTGGTADALVVNKLYPGYGVPLVNSYSERFTAIRTNDTVSVTAGKTYTETISLFADGTITAASINFNTPNGDHIVPAYVTGSQTGGYTLTATYTTETGGTTIRMPDITYLSGTAANVVITSASLVQQKTNLFTPTGFAALYLYDPAGNIASVLQSDGSRTVTKAGGIASSNQSINSSLVAITTGAAYQTSVISSWPMPSDLNYTDRGSISTSACTSTVLGSYYRSTCAAYTAVSGDNGKAVPNFYNIAGLPTSINIIDISFINTAEAAPATTNLYTGSFDDLYHYTAAHTTNATAQTSTIKKLSVSNDGAMTWW